MILQIEVESVIKEKKRHSNLKEKGHVIGEKMEFGVFPNSFLRKI